MNEELSNVVEAATDTATEGLATVVTNAATTVASATTSAIQTTISSVADVAEDGIGEITDKIEELTAEIKTTKSIWVKIRNTVEIGVLGTLLAKAASKLADKL